MNRTVPFIPDSVRNRGEIPPEHAATFTLDRQVAAARKRMGEARWNELQAEWPVLNDARRG